MSYRVNLFDEFYDNFMKSEIQEGYPGLLMTKFQTIFFKDLMKNLLPIQIFNHINKRTLTMFIKGYETETFKLPDIDLNVFKRIVEWGCIYEEYDFLEEFIEEASIKHVKGTIFKNYFAKPMLAICSPKKYKFNDVYEDLKFGAEIYKELDILFLKAKVDFFAFEINKLAFENLLVKNKKDNSSTPLSDRLTFHKNLQESSVNNKFRIEEESINCFVHNDYMLLKQFEKRKTMLSANN
jgi:hypothetical protein